MMDSEKGEISPSSSARAEHFADGVSGNADLFADSDALELAGTDQLIYFTAADTQNLPRFIRSQEQGQIINAQHYIVSSFSHKPTKTACGFV